MIPVLQVLAVYGLIQSITAPAGSLFRAIGQPKIGFMMNAIRVGVMAATIYPLTMKFGISGTALSVVAGSIGKMSIFLIFSKKTLGVSYYELWRGIKATLFVSSVTGFSMLILQMFAYQPGLEFFLGEGVCFIILYMGVSYLTWRWFEGGPLSSLKLMRELSQRGRNEYLAN